jgi:ABC-type Fe3+-hydroxamate transport system substrate-binding protein
MEQILLLSPDIIIVTTMSGKGESDAVVEGWRQWTRLPAVKNDRDLCGGFRSVRPAGASDYRCS